MPDDEAPPRAPVRTQAALRRSHWPGWIWSVPLAAALILAWLAVRFFVIHGIAATVTFDDASGVAVQSTKVTYRGVAVGQVSSVALSGDGRHVTVGLRLDRSMGKYLRSGTRFWLQGASLANPSSLGAIISGPTIRMEPGPGRPRRHFVGLKEAPAYPQPVAGRHFTLVARTRGTIRVGSAVDYLGLAVGKVTAVRLVAPDEFRIDALVRAPYDQLVHAGSRFWDAGALQLSVSNGLHLQLPSVSALIEGAIAFETSQAAAAEPHSPAGTVFRLYPDRDSAELAPVGPVALFRVQFPGAVGALKIGAPVKLRDFIIGQVREVDLDYDAAKGVLNTPVIIALDENRLHITGTTRNGSAAGSRLLDKALSRLVRKGLRAQLAQDPQLIGPYYVALDFVPTARPANLDLHGAIPEIPSAAGGGLAALTAQLGELPIRQIGANARRISARLDALISSPQIDASVRHLDDSLEALDRITREAQPQIGPLIAALRAAASQIQATVSAAKTAIGGPEQQRGLDQAIGELTRAARSVRVLADYLERHPESLIRGKRR